MDIGEFVNGVSGLSGGATERVFLLNGTFFKPYTSIGDLLFRPLSVVTAPIGFGVCAVAFTLDAGYELLKVIGNAILLEFDDSKEGLETFLDKLYAIFTAVLLMIVSPVVNLVDCLGALIVTIEEDVDSFLACIGGATFTALNNAMDKKPISFFQPYRSVGDIFSRIVSIGAAPVALGISSAFFALAAGYSLLSAIGNVCVLDFSASIKNLDNVYILVIESLIVAISAIVSPLINLTDCVGAIFTSLNPSGNDDESQLISVFDEVDYNPNRVSY